MKYGLKFLNPNQENPMPDLKPPSIAAEFEKELAKRLAQMRSGQSPMSTSEIALTVIALHLSDMQQQQQRAQRDSVPTIPVKTRDAG